MVAAEMEPEGGWWHGDTADVLEDVVAGLVGRGVPLDEAVGAVARVKGAIANEYGA